MPPPLFVTFVAGSAGAWRIDRIDAVIGDGLPTADRMMIHEGTRAADPECDGWTLHGVTSNMRYTNRRETDALLAVQQGLHRREATKAAFIPIRKNELWWSLPQDERRAIFEEESRHIGLGLEYLPAIARRPHHSQYA